MPLDSFLQVFHKNGLSIAYPQSYPQKINIPLAPPIYIIYTIRMIRTSAIIILIALTLGTASAIYVTNINSIWLYIKLLTLGLAAAWLFLLLIYAKWE